MSNFCSLKIVQQLRLVQGKQRGYRFQFDDNLPHNDIRNVFANYETILVAHLDRDLPPTSRPYSSSRWTSPLSYTFSRYPAHKYKCKSYATCRITSHSLKISTPSIFVLCGYKSSQPISVVLSRIIHLDKFTNMDCVFKCNSSPRKADTKTTAQEFLLLVIHLITNLCHHKKWD